MDLKIKTETFGQDDQSWLASAHGTDTARSINIDVATFTAGTHYPEGYLKSGLPLKKVAAGRYGLWSNGDTDPFRVTSLQPRRFPPARPSSLVPCTGTALSSWRSCPPPSTQLARPLPSPSATSKETEQWHSC
ncbi:hypothetical protein [Rhodococcus sp. JVH1]|uniref:hypothetical protein n=1 Tax=Rhodococcus sp. JVH1 TaxID=745408 RepID=UPI00027207FE|nr:hypothetical protein [Rhodococcus sp. JVH1]EJJ01035.1 hypothetical protein JVH1_1661 [Rhodococcus sp. JVH1]